MKMRNFLVMLLVAIISAGLFYVGREHLGHLLGILPYLLFLSCPLMHLFMHHGHGNDRGHHGKSTLPPPAA